MIAAHFPGRTGFVVLLACVVSTIASGRVGAQDSKSGAPTLSAARITAQIAGGTIAAPVAFFGGGYASKRIARASGAADETASRAGYIGGYATTWLATAAVPAAIAHDGKFPSALAGSALGLLASVGVVRLGNAIYDGGRRECGIVCWTLGAAVAALPSIGATVLYDRSRH